MKDLEKMLMSKKSKGALSKTETQAKMDVLEELLQMAQSAMGSKVKGGMDEMKKISVMAPDTESLTEGLDLAKEVAESTEEVDSSTEMSQEDDSEMKEKLEEMKAKSSDEEESEEDDSNDSMFAKKPAKKKSIYSMDDED